jgi:hypothetical protein
MNLSGVIHEIAAKAIDAIVLRPQCDVEVADLTGGVTLWPASTNKSSMSAACCQRTLSRSRAHSREPARSSALS